MVFTMVSASSGATNSLLAKLATLMGEEYGKLKGVSKEVKFLEDEFRSMTALLDKLSDMDGLDIQVKEWRNQVREMSYDIEDCIDDFMHHLDTHAAGIKFANRTARLLKKLRKRHQIANKIQEVKSLVKVVSERRVRYKIGEYTTNKSDYVLVDPRVVAIYAEAAALVGIDAPLDDLAKLLMSKDAKLRVTSIVGFGGLGKTTLANEVYRRLEGRFECRAFVSVSQRPDITRVLNIILSELKRQYLPQMYDQLPHTCEVKDLLRDIRKFIHDKRYS